MRVRHLLLSFDIHTGYRGFSHGEPRCFSHCSCCGIFLFSANCILRSFPGQIHHVPSRVTHTRLISLHTVNQNFTILLIFPVCAGCPAFTEYYSQYVVSPIPVPMGPSRIQNSLTILNFQIFCARTAHNHPARSTNA